MAIDVRGVCTLLQVYDMPTSVKFYRDVLGFEIVSASSQLGEDMFHWCWLKLGAAEIMLNTAYESNQKRPATPDPARQAAHDDTCLYFACPDVDAAYEELNGKLSRLRKPAVAGYGMKQMYLHDPDGYGLCFQWRVSD